MHAPIFDCAAMRILVISDLPQFVVGGAEMQALRLIEAWISGGHEVMCFGRRTRNGRLPVAGGNVETRRIRTFNLFGRWFRALSYFVSLSWLMLRHRRWPDVVYTRFLGDAAATISLLKTAGLIRCVLVATPANSGADGDAKYLRSIPGHGWLIRRMAEQCDAINLIAPGMAVHFEALGFDVARFARIPNGIPLRPLPERPVNHRGLRLLAVGRLTMQKGYDLLLQALGRAADRFPDFSVQIIGDGPERESLRREAARLGLTDRIVWRGELDVRRIREALENADLFVLPSRYEGMSNAALEAMESGLPLILTRCDGIDAYLHADLAWVVPVGDVPAIAQAVESALTIPRADLRAMGFRCRELVKREFDMSTVAHRYLDLFERLGAPPSRRG